MRIEKSIFDRLGGTDIFAYKLINSKNEYVKILTLGGVINELVVNDKNGTPADIVCGYDSADKYMSAAGYQGALIGRYSNRISNASFTLDGTKYNLFVNSGTKDSLHGGKIGFDKKIWECVPFERENEVGLVMSIVSPDMEEGYPGTLNVTVTYTFTEDAKLSINYKATTDKATPVNLTNHAYFNLDGFDAGSVMNHNLTIIADKYIEVDEDQIPTGDPINVAGTDFDFNTDRKITTPYDHCWMFGDYNGMIKKRACMYSENSGRRLTLYTNLPAVQLYTACVMDGPVNFKNNVPQRKLHAACLETQYAPDSPNRPDYPSCILRPDEVYDFTTIFAFDTI